MLLLLVLRNSEMASDPSAARIHAGRPAVDDCAARIEVDHEPRPIHWLFSRFSWTLPISVMSLRSRS